MLRFHHSISLADCSFSEITPSEKMSSRESLDFLPAYRWLSHKIGHWPLFMAVGDDPWDLRITGYQNQWLRVLSSSAKGNVYRKAGESPSYVLFSFTQVPKASFSDYHAWHGPLNGGMGPEAEKSVLCPGRSEKLWLQKARRSPGSVQAHVPSLDLRRADRIWCRSQKVRKQLIGMGFDPKLVEVRRLPVQ